MIIITIITIAVTNSNNSNSNNSTNDNNSSNSSHTSSLLNIADFYFNVEINSRGPFPTTSPLLNSCLMSFDSFIWIVWIFIDKQFQDIEISRIVWHSNDILWMSLIPQAENILHRLSGTPLYPHFNETGMQGVCDTLNLCRIVSPYRNYPTTSPFVNSLCGALCGKCVIHTHI